jgi:hypothetical protein
MAGFRPDIHVNVDRLGMWIETKTWIAGIGKRSDAVLRTAMIRS